MISMPMLRISIESIGAVAGTDYETAVVPEERRKYLAHYGSSILAKGWLSG
jgi:hypothetical protein